MTDAALTFPSVGDSTNMMLPIIIGVVAAVVIIVAIVLIVRSRKRH